MIQAGCIVKTAAGNPCVCVCVTLQKHTRTTHTFLKECLKETRCLQEEEMLTRVCTETVVTK